MRAVSQGALRAPAIKHSESGTTSYERERHLAPVISLYSGWEVVNDGCCDWHSECFFKRACPMPHVEASVNEPLG